MAEDVQVTDPVATGDEPASQAPHAPTDDPGQTAPSPQSKATEPASPETGPADDLPKWHYSLPGPLRGHEALKSHATIGDAAKELVDLKGRTERMVEVPAADSTLEERERFFKAIGRPETPAGYELKRPSDWPANMPWDQREAQRFAEHAYKAGIPKGQAEQMYGDLAANARNQLLDMTAAQQKERKQWGEELARNYGDQAEGNVKIAHRALEVIGSPALKAKLEKAGLLEYPPLVAMALNAWNGIGEDKIFAGAVDPGGKNEADRIRQMYPNTNW